MNKNFSIVLLVSLPLIGLLAEVREGISCERVLSSEEMEHQPGGLSAAKDGDRVGKWAEPMALAGVPNLHKVSDRLYRSAQPTAEGMTNLVALGIKTVVNLRDNHSDSDEIGGLPLKARRIEIFTGNMKDKYVDEFLSIVDDTNAVPVLVHCQHGADRTGTMCAMYRILRQGWTVDAAIDEMKNGGFGYHSIWGNLPRFIRKSARKRAKAGVER